MRGTIDVACLVLVSRQGRFFTAQRSPHKTLGNLWEFPGGKVENGETPECALRRELQEELQLEVGPLHALPSVTHAYDFAVIRLLPFLSFCEELPSIHVTEHIASRWVTMAEARDLRWAPADLPILDSIEAYFAS